MCTALSGTKGHRSALGRRFTSLLWRHWDNAPAPNLPRRRRSAAADGEGFRRHLLNFLEQRSSLASAGRAFAEGSCIAHCSAEHLLGGHHLSSHAPQPPTLILGCLSLQHPAFGTLYPARRAPGGHLLRSVALEAVRGTSQRLCVTFSGLPDLRSRPSKAGRRQGRRRLNGPKYIAARLGRCHGSLGAASSRGSLHGRARAR